MSNTSPLTSLAAIGQFELLRELFGYIHISRAVEAELYFGGNVWPGAAEVHQASWIEIHDVADRNTVDALRLDLDTGESETIALALHLQADLVLLDEQAGRRATSHFGYDVMGVVGVLLRAKHIRLVPEVRPLLDALRDQAGFYLSEPVVVHALKLAGEL